MQKILEKYEQLKSTPSDINELMGYLKQYTEGYSHITELGTRRAVSTYAFMANKPEKLVCYDICRYEEIAEVERLCKENGINFEFKEQDSIKEQIEETSIMFLDTFHVASQIYKELTLHAPKVKHRIIGHDFFTFYENGETPYFSHLDYSGWDMRGIRYGIEPFLAQNPQWKMIFSTHINNGLFVLERQ